MAAKHDSQTAQDKMAATMAELYRESAAKFARGTAVYLGSQVWTVGMEVEGLAQITRNGRTRYVPTGDLSLVTDQDEFRGSAFAHLKRRA
jgi:hypothetical protein